MERPGPRHIRLVLVGDDERRPLGVLPELEVSVPWWQEAGPVVDAVGERFGVEVTILRLLEVFRETPASETLDGQAMTYLAEVAPSADVSSLPLESWPGRLRDDPRRMPWARPGGPARDLAWADGVLRARGLARRGPARQVRSWNLSSLWTLPLSGGERAWLKVVPPFFAHEGRVLEHLAGGPVPALLGHEGARILMPELPGEDQHDAGRPLLDRMIDTLVDLQIAEAAHVGELMALGLPDWRGPALTAAIRGLIDRRRPDLDADARTRLDGFAASLDERVAAIESCGLPDTLVHGDFHPGNVRSDGERIILLDWGDCGVGQPLLDEAAFMHVRPGIAGDLRASWHARWRAHVPGSDPERASRLLRPIAAARQALIYQRFLDAIEPTERPYHERDVPVWLGIAADAVRREGEA